MDKILRSIFQSEQYEKRVQESKHAVKLRHTFDDYVKSKRYKNIRKLLLKFLESNRVVTHSQVCKFMDFYNVLEINFVLYQLFQDKDVFIVANYIIIDAFLEGWLEGNLPMLDVSARANLIAQHPIAFDFSDQDIAHELKGPFLKFSKPFEFLNKKFDKMKLAEFLLAQK